MAHASVPDAGKAAISINAIYFTYTNNTVTMWRYGSGCLLVVYGRTRASNKGASTLLGVATCGVDLLQPYTNNPGGTLKKRPQIESMTSVYLLRA